VTTTSPPAWAKNLPFVMALNPPSIDKRLVELTQHNLEQTRQQSPQPNRQQSRLIQSKSVLFLTAGVVLLAVLIAVGH
jgi:hypothetical protein